MSAVGTRTARLRGVRVHNLKGIDLDLPLGRVIAFTGVSGSGKSSLAFDTLYVEGQRRYLETFSTQARQLLGPLEKPEADLLEGIPPALGVGQWAGSRRPSRSTVGSITEIDAYLALIYARIGKVFCRACGTEVAPEDAEAVSAAIAALPPGARYQVAFPVEVGPEADLDALAAALRAEGFLRLWIEGRPHRLSDAIPPRPESGRWDVVVDRLVAGSDEAGRRHDAIETAFVRGRGRCRLITDTAERAFVRGWVCGTCGAAAAAPEPALFRPSSPLGACPTCAGSGHAPDQGPETACPACGGARLQPQALAVRVGGKNIAELRALTVVEALAFLDATPLADGPLGRRLLGPIRRQLETLEQIGLGYLPLDRPATTLSRGEARRVRLAAALGSGLVNALYVLDEPSIGLHPRDTARLVAAVRALRDQGNTVILVEHDRQLIEAADLLVDIGPKAGEAGGRIVCTGPPAAVAECPESLTGAALAGRLQRPQPPARRPLDQGRIELFGAAGRNLKGIDVAFPLRVFCVVTGVSGAGKSTLVEQTLYPALRRRFDKKAATPAAPYRKLRISGELAGVALVDPSPISRGPRSNPATYVGAYAEIRRTFAATHEARVRNYGPGAFSFNVEGGRCSACEGSGHRRIDMQFLPDVLIRCPECRGTRFRPEVREVTYRGKNIAEVLELTVREALGFFRNRPKIQARLRPLLDVGLDYLRLGQPAATLSGGECQRLKLAAFLGSTAAAIERLAAGPKTLFLLDEPTTGLHPADVAVLLGALDRLVDLGHSLIVIEHDPAVIAHADWILDLGPDAGPAGGRLVAAGPPAEVAQADTPTGRALAAFLAAPAAGSHALPEPPPHQGLSAR